MRFFVLSLLYACASEEGVKVYNSNPEATITSVGSSSSFMEGDQETLVGQVSDGNHAASELMVRWESTDRILCDDVLANVDGSTSCDVVLGASDNTIILNVFDPEGAAGTDQVDITITENNAPTAMIISPISESQHYSSQLIQFSALLDDEEDDSSVLVYSWTSSIDGILPSMAEPDADGMIEEYFILSEGQHAIALDITDSAGKTTTETVVIVVGGPNNAPICSITSPQSQSAFVISQNITFSGTAIDEDINNSLLNISWTSDQDGVFNTNIADSSGDMEFYFDGLSAGNHSIMLRVEDEAGEFCTDSILLSIGSAPTIVVNSPTQGSVHTLSESIVFSGTITDSEDLDSDIQVSWDSDIDGVFSTQGPDSNGAISFTHSSLSAGLHNLIITATDTTSLTSTSSMSLRVNTPPTEPVLTIQPSIATSVIDLEVLATSTDADGDSLTYTYEWLEDSILTSFTTSSIVASQLDVDKIWTVRVTANDGYVDGPTAEYSVIISNTEPSISNVAIAPNSTVYNDSVLTCTATATDLDELVTASFEWSIGNTTYSGASLDLSTTTAMPSDLVQCTATVLDSNGGSAFDSVSVVIENRAPSVDSISLTPSSPSRSDTLICSASASDPDGEIPSLDFSWNNTTTGDTYTSSTSSAQMATLDVSTLAVSSGDVVECSVTATDAQGEMTSQSQSAVIADEAPSFDVAATITPSSSIFTGTSLNCSATAIDPEDGALIPNYEWFVGSTSVGTGDMYTVDANQSNVGDSLTCTATVVDSDANVVTSSVQVTIENTIPTMASISISPGAPMAGQDDLICTIDSPSSDVDLQSLSYSYSWQKNGVTTSHGTDTVPASDVVQHDSWICFATPNDGIDDGPTAQSAAISIGGSCPSSNPTFSTPSDVIAYEPCTELDSISFAAVNSITDLSLPNLVTVHGDIYAHNVSGFQTVSMPLLESVGGYVYFYHSYDIEVVELNALESVGEYLYFDTNTALFDLNLDSLTYVDDYSYFSNNTLLCVPELTWNSIAQNYHYDNGNRDCTSQTYTYSGGVQYFDVPNVTEIDVVLYGAKAGDGWNTDVGTARGFGGEGGVVTATLTVTPGEVLSIYVGGSGEDAGSGYAGNGGYNGGGNGAISPNGWQYFGGGGGGATDIRRGTGIADRLIVSGGGGAGSGWCTSGAGNGGNGGGLVGETGQVCSNHSAGSGGTQSSGGSSGGIFGIGGSASTYGGSGGGGGYYGGGASDGSGGGGGSSYLDSTAIGTMSTGGNTGDGYIIISW